MLSEAGKHYGENIIGKYATRLQKEVGKKYNNRTLRRYRQFYETYREAKWSPMATKLSWSHYIELLPLNDFNKIKYYTDICEKNNLSRNNLEKELNQKNMKDFQMKQKRS